MSREGPRAFLDRHSMRVTACRVRILDVLRRAERPVSAADLHAGLGEDRPDLVTVYRTLERFVATSIVRRIQLGDGVRRYELTERGHHHHLVCTACGEVKDLLSCGIAPLEKHALKEYGFQVSSHMLELFGTCQECSPKTM